MCAFTACVRFLRRRGPAGLQNLFFDSASATERTRGFCGLFLLHIAKYAANRCIYSTNLSIPFCAAPL